MAVLSHNVAGEDDDHFDTPRPKANQQRTGLVNGGRLHAGNPLERRFRPMYEWATIRSEVRSPGCLTEPMEPLPQQMPRLARASAHEDIGAIPDGNVLDAIWNRKLAGKLAGLEHRIEVGA